MRRFQPPKPMTLHNTLEPFPYSVDVRIVFPGARAINLRGRGHINVLTRYKMTRTDFRSDRQDGIFRHLKLLYFVFWRHTSLPEMTK